METRDVGLDESGGTQQALNQLFAAAYEELRRMARTINAQYAASTLNPTALVNETWLKLMNSPQFSALSPLHFKRIAARAMRQVLVDGARRRNAFKRGGREHIVITFDDQMNEASCGRDMLALDEALHELEQLEPRQALLVECRFFGGLDVDEAAKLLNVSPATVQRDWRVAKAWLKHKLKAAQ